MDSERKSNVQSRFCTIARKCLLLTNNMCIARIGERDLRSDERRHFIEKIINDLR